MPLKLRLAAFLLIVLCGAAFGQASFQEWQAKAIHKYPELGISGSGFNKRFVEAYNERRKTAPRFFDNPQWPLTLADELANNSFTTSQTVPTRASPSSTDLDVPSIWSLDTIRSFFSDPTHLVVTALIALAVLFKLFSDYRGAQRRKHPLKTSKPATPDYNDPLTNPNALWRADPASQAQKRKLTFYGQSIKREITKGEASDLIDRVIAQHPEKETDYRKWKQLEEDIDEWYDRVIGCDFVDDGSMQKPTRQMVRETIIDLNDKKPNWSSKEGPNGFAIILMKRYPQLDKGEV